MIVFGFIAVLMVWGFVCFMVWVVKKKWGGDEWEGGMIGRVMLIF